MKMKKWNDIPIIRPFKEPRQRIRQPRLSDCIVFENKSEGFTTFEKYAKGL
jgi:hypothetical protein